jgi:hypothetical protein
MLRSILPRLCLTRQSLNHGAKADPPKVFRLPRFLAKLRELNRAPDL